jgi:hypothetical protein
MAKRKKSSMSGGKNVSRGGVFGSLGKSWSTAKMAGSVNARFTKRGPTAPQPK